jgi:hypothetical protein
VTLAADGGLIISAASLWLLQHAISDARGNGDHAAVCIEVIDDDTNPQSVISTTLPRSVSEPVSAATRCAVLVLGSCCQCGVAAVVDAAVARLLQASHDVMGAGGDVPSRDGESAARSASSAVRCRVNWRSL